jgi:hypothetical protein
MSVESDFRESLDRARDFFGDPVQRQQDRVSLVGKSVLEEYARGNIALALYCQFSSPQSNLDLPRIVSVHNGQLDDFSLIILQANLANPRKPEHRNQELMFVSDIQVVQGPQKSIPSFVWLYRVQYESVNSIIYLPLFESCIKGGFQYISGISERESAPFGRSAFTEPDNLAPKNVETASEIVQRVSNNQGRFRVWKCTQTQINSQPIESIFVHLDRNSVRVGVSESSQEQVQIVDVLFGPLNFRLGTKKLL